MFGLSQNRLAIPQMLMVNPPFRPEHGFNMVTVIIMRSIYLFPWKIQWIRVSSPCFLKHIETSPIFSLFLVDLVAKNCRWISSSAWPICNAWVLGVWTMWRPGSGGPIPPCRCRPSDLWRRARHMTAWCRVPGGESEWKWRLLVDVDDYIYYIYYIQVMYYIYRL